MLKNGFVIVELIFVLLTILGTPAFGAECETPDQSYLRQVFSTLDKIFSPLAKKHSAQLQFIFDSTSSSQDPHAGTQTNGLWPVKVPAHFLSIPGLTKDALWFTLCHEAGHHLAGAPFNAPADYRSAEGQADFFATQICLRKVWQNDTDENLRAAININPAFQEECDKAWVTTTDRALCYREIQAGYSMFSTLADQYKQFGVKPPDPNSQDLSKVAQTTVGWMYPSLQCRLDTVVAGALCNDEAHVFESIPGRPELTGAAPGYCSGPLFPKYMKRPPCWFVDSSGGN
jgi:hypothetical protein